MSRTESSEINTMPKAKTTVFTLNTLTTKSDIHHLKNIKYYPLLKFYRTVQSHFKISKSIFDSMKIVAHSIGNVRYPWLLSVSISKLSSELLTYMVFSKG